jgi:hypothetical protein
LGESPNTKNPCYIKAPTRKNGAGKKPKPIFFVQEAAKISGAFYPYAKKPRRVEAPTRFFRDA